MKMLAVVWLLLQALAVAAEQTVPLQSCQIPVTHCPGESNVAPPDWEAAAQLSCERYAPYVCLPLDQSCQCAKRSRLTACKLLNRPLPSEAGRRSAYAQTEMQGLDSSRGPWTVVSAFPYCSCPANAVFNTKGQCVCAPGASYAPGLRQCVVASTVANKSGPPSAKPRL